MSETSDVLIDRLALPERVVVGMNGAYWRAYDGYYSMCPVSDDNDPVIPVAEFVRLPAGSLVVSPEVVKEIERRRDEAMEAATGRWMGENRGLATAYGIVLSLLASGKADGA